MSDQRLYRIGELAADSGSSRDALRYYERLGLMPRARRTTGGFGYSHRERWTGFASSSRRRSMD